MPTIYPPQYLENLNGIKIFLAGSIDNGKSINWQENITKLINKIDPKINILNPRRPDWDAYSEQSIQNNYFFQQVNWELDNLDIADIVIFYFAPNSVSPITLMELGNRLAENKNKNQSIIVYCPEDFWRKGNVDIICKRYNVKVYSKEDDFYLNLIEKIC